jgi:4-hydroxyphenylpyruvate dioxygenase
MTIREGNPESSNPLGLDGIEFIEFATSQPQALGKVLQMMGFAPIARHRSREVTLYRQGGMNLIVNAHPEAVPGMAAPDAAPVLSALAFRVRDSAAAWQHALDLGAMEQPPRVSAMELNIPGIHGVGDTLVYFVDRYRDFSIYDVDFAPLPGADPHPPAIQGMHYFGVVQSVLAERSSDWIDFYRRLFGFTVLPEGQYFGVLPKGTLLESPCHKFYLQLIEPPAGAEDAHWDESLVRIGLGTPDVLAAVKALQSRGVVFIDHKSVQPSDKGALTQVYLHDVTFELVVSHLQPQPLAGHAA